MAVDHLLGDDPGLEDPWAFVLTAAIILAVATVLFATVVRPSLAPRRAPLVLAILAVLSLAFIWIGLPFAAAPAAVALGLRVRAARNRGDRGRCRRPAARNRRLRLPGG
ncbi:MAG TPA: hypothetical protein VFO88_09735 [Gaiellaceae bacterium]|nr:hypothetical protein [Gaiellaceae bacterium]